MKSRPDSSSRERRASPRVRPFLKRYLAQRPRNPADRRLASPVLPLAAMFSWSRAGRWKTGAALAAGLLALTMILLLWIVVAFVSGCRFSRAA